MLVSLLNMTVATPNVLLAPLILANFQEKDRSIDTTLNRAFTFDSYCSTALGKVNTSRKKPIKDG